MDKIDKVIKYFRELREEVSAPTNALVHGKIAGTPESGDAPVVKRKSKKYIYGKRKVWLDFLKK